MTADKPHSQICGDINGGSAVKRPYDEDGIKKRGVSETLTNMRVFELSKVYEES